MRRRRGRREAVALAALALAACARGAGDGGGIGASVPDPAGLAAAGAPEAGEPASAPGDRRLVSPDGRRALLVAGDGSRARWALVARAPGAPPLADARIPAPWEYAPDAPASLAPEPGDRVISRGTSATPVEDARVLDDGTAVLLHGAPAGATADAEAPALSRILADGAVAWVLPRAALPEPLRIGVPRAWWVDAARGTVFMAGGGAMVEVPLLDPVPRRAEAAALASRAASGPEEERELALECGIDDPAPPLPATARALVTNPATPEGVVLRAMEILRAAGEPVAGAAERFRAAALREDLPPRTRAFAVARLPALLGPDALPAVLAVMGGEADLAWRAALVAAAELGEAAVPALVALLDDSEASLDARGGAAAVLGAVRATAAIPALWRAAERFDRARDPHDHVPGQALDALLAMRPDGIGHRLVAMLAAGTPHDGRIAGFLAAHPHPSAAPALVAALERAAPHAWERRVLVRALRACTGLDGGDDPAAWRRAVEAAGSGGASGPGGAPR